MTFGSLRSGRPQQVGRLFLLAACLGLLGAGAGGCKKAAPPGTEAAEKSDKSTKGSDKTDKKDDKKVAKSDDADEDSAKYAHGDVLKHVPKSCPQGRVYIDVAALLKNEAIAVNADHLDDKLAEAIKGEEGERAEKALKGLKKAGLAPAKVIKEVAVCILSDKKDDVVASVGGDFAGKDVLGEIQKAAETADGEELKKKDAEGVPYLRGTKSKRGSVVGLVTPNVLAIAKSDEALPDLKKSRTPSDKWGVAKGRIIDASFHDKRSENNIEVALTDKGDDLELKIVAQLGGKEAKRIKADPAGFKKQIKGMLAGLSKQMEKTPAKELADDVADAKIDIDGDTVTVTATPSTKDVAAVVKQITSSSEEDLEKVFR